ncbi:MAG: dihydroorotase [Xanthomonadales bacterium]|nr:dihydroorotase [Gammaproteobacteria bacterium]MBT8074494.1 dihydroorotase [Gammaproteobacteria bacterium]NNK05348.1 dihydroorotase [Xanthomonadales bacterium]
MNTTTVIRNALLVNEGQLLESDVLLKDGRIEKIAGGIEAPAGALLIDANGRHLLPGMIDDQVHFREPGLTHKGDFYSESRAAIAGGVTSYMEMPNSKPPTTDAEQLEWKYARAAETSAANFGFYFGATNDNIENIKALDPASTCGVKVFMGASTGNMLVDNESTLAAIFRESPVIIATHCESTPMITANLKRAMAEFGKNIPVTEHAKIRSEEACYASSELAVALANKYSAQLHVLHLSTARELSLFKPGPMSGKDITAEACVHFLHFDESQYAQYGNRIKCNPAIKSANDRTALIEAVADGRLDIIATDHAPHTSEEKAEESYLSAPSGLPLVQDVLVAALELVHDGKLDLHTVVRGVTHNPARRFSVVDRGFIREGYHADLVLVDMHGTTEVTNEKVLSRCGWSPFEGRRFKSRIDAVWVNGALAFDGNEVIEHGAAQRLQFNHKPR